MHVAGELFKKLSGIDIVRVPYMLGGTALAGLIRGDIEVGFLPAIIAAPHVRSDRMRGIAVTSSERLAAFPQVPTMSESGMPTFDYASWYGLLAPAGTSESRIVAINGHLKNAVNRSDVIERMAGIGAEIIVSSSEDFGAHLRAELAKWAQVVEAGTLH
jgi:tripartite-type tricarboxylate transporter receptor subunit TctC